MDYTEQADKEVCAAIADLREKHWGIPVSMTEHDWLLTRKYPEMKLLVSQQAEVLRLREENAKLDMALKEACGDLSDQQYGNGSHASDYEQHYLRISAAELGKEPPCQS